MKYWPVPTSYSKSIPKKPYPGSFWKERGDRFHCGIDIYAPAGSRVISVNEGNVIKTGIFTNKTIISYWKKTKYILMKNIDGFFCLYIELNDVVVKRKQFVKAGQLIGHFGLVLDKIYITNDSPLYIQKILENNNLSMLHFEVYTSNPIWDKKYQGGNWFCKKRPKNIIDPNIYLKNIIFDKT